MRQGSDSHGFVRIKHTEYEPTTHFYNFLLKYRSFMWDFEHGTTGADFDISYTVPSACASELQAGKADIGIIPAAAYAHIPDLAVVPGVAIAARRAVRSILLVSKVPLERVRTVALDTSSMTSVALTKVLFDRWLGSGRVFTPMAPHVDGMLQEHDACLVIGDTALKLIVQGIWRLIWRKSGFVSPGSHSCSRSGQFDARHWRTVRLI